MVERVNDGAPGKGTSAVDLAGSVISHSGVILPGTVECERETATDVVRYDIFCVPLPILLGTLKSERSALNWNGTLPLHRPPPKLPGHEVAVSTSKMSAFAGGANIAVAKIAVAPTIMNLGLLIDGISIIQYDELTPPPK